MDVMSGDGDERGCLGGLLLIVDVTLGNFIVVRKVFVRFDSIKISENNVLNKF